MKKENFSTLAISAIRISFKISLLLLLVGSGLLVYAVSESDLDGSYYEVDAGQTLVTSSTYREAGDELQIAVGLTNEEEYQEGYLESNDLLQIRVYKALTYQFIDKELVISMEANGMMRDIDVYEKSYYRLEITNLSENKVTFVTGNAKANLGALAALVLAAVMIAIGISILSFMFSMVVTVLILGAIFIPVYLLVKSQIQPKYIYVTQPQVQTQTEKPLDKQ